MKKIPVGATIAHAYRFAFKEFFPLIKLFWLPLVGMLGCNMLTGPNIAVLTQGLKTHDFSGLTMPWWLVVASIAATWLFAFMLMTGFFQYALGQIAPENRTPYITFARPLWRLMGAFLLLIAAIVALAILFVLAVVIILFLFRLGLSAAHVSDTALKAILAFDIGVAFLVGYCGFIFCFLRFGFLLGATTIAEGRVSLSRSWGLSHKNFWRMFVISVALFSPLMVVESIGFYAFGLFPHMPVGASAEEIRALQDAASMAAMARMQHYWYLVYPIAGIFSVFVYALMTAGGAFAYRALTESEATPNPR